MNANGFGKRAMMALLLAGTFLGGRLMAEDEDYARWYFSPGVGFYLTEGDEPVEDGFILNARLGYDLNEWWSLEGGLLFAPSLDEQFLPTGESCVDKTSKTPFFEDTWMATVFVDALFHFTRWERMDPYLAGGLGFVLYGEDALDKGESSSAAVLRAGAGLMYHFNDSWAIRGD